MNAGTWIVNLGKDPEELTLGDRQLVKLRCAEKAANKKATTRWMSALLGGPDRESAMKLRKGDSIALTGELVRTEYKPTKGPNKGQVVSEDEIPYARLFRVIKSATFFGDDAPSFNPETASGGDDDPLAGL